MQFFEKVFNFKSMWIGKYSTYYSNPIYQKNRLDLIYSAHFELEAYDKYRRIYLEKRLPPKKTAVFLGGKGPM